MCGGKRGERQNDRCQNWQLCVVLTCACQTNRQTDQPTDSYDLLQIKDDAHERILYFFCLLTSFLPHSYSCSNAHQLNINPYHYQSTLNHQGYVSSLEKCLYYKLSEQSATKLTSVQKPWIRFQYTNTHKCGECTLTSEERLAIIKYYFWESLNISNKQFCFPFSQENVLRESDCALNILKFRH